MSTNSYASGLMKSLQTADSHSCNLNSHKVDSSLSSEDVFREITPGNGILHQKAYTSWNGSLDTSFQGSGLPSLSFRGGLRVSCMNTAGELLVNEMGLLGVLCFCHMLPMSLAEFCQHSGLSSANPGEVIRFENGMRVAEWHKMCSGKFAPDASIGTDWSRHSSMKYSSIGSKASSFHSLPKNDVSMESVEALGRLGKSVEPRKNSLYDWCPDFVQRASLGKPVNNDPDNAYKSSGMEGNDLHLRSLACLAEKQKLHALQGISEFTIFSRPHSTSNEGEPIIRSKVFSGNNNSRDNSGNTSVYKASSVCKKTFSHDNHNSTQFNSPNEVHVIDDSDDADLRLGQPSQHKQSSSCLFSGTKDIPFQAASTFPKVQEYKQLTDETVCAREAKRARLVQPYPVTDASLSGRRLSQIGFGRTNCFSYSESEDLLKYARKDSSISLFLSQLNGGTDLSSSIDNVPDGNSYMESSSNSEFLLSRSNLSDFSKDNLGETEKASALNELDYFNERGQPSWCSNQSFGTLQMGPDCKNSNRHGNFPSLGIRDHYNHCIHSFKNPVFQSTELSSFDSKNLSSEAPTGGSSSNGGYIPDLSCLSCKQNIHLSQNAMDGKLGFWTFGRHEKQLSSSLNMHPQHGNLCCLSAFESHRKPCKDDLVSHKEGTHCSFHQDESDLHSLPNYCCKNDFGIARCKKPVSVVSHQCCSCVVSTQSTLSCSTIPSHVSDTDPQLSLSSREILNDSSIKTVEHELCIHKGKNLSISGKCCCAIFSKCLMGCCLNGAVKPAGGFNEQNFCGTCNKDIAFQRGPLAELDEFVCRKKRAISENNFQSGLWRDVTGMNVGYSVATTENIAKGGLEAPGVVKDLPEEIASKELDKTFRVCMSRNEHTSNLCSASSAPAITEASVEIDKRVVLLSNASSTKILQGSINDEGSGIEKCSSSDEVLGAKACEESPDTNSKGLTIKSGSCSISSNSSGHSMDDLTYISSCDRQKRLRKQDPVAHTDQENYCRSQQMSEETKLKRKESCCHLVHSEPSKLMDAKLYLTSSKFNEAVTKPVNFIHGTHKVSSKFLKIKQKQSRLSPCKYISLKKMKNYTNASKLDKLRVDMNNYVLEEPKFSAAMMETPNFTLQGKKQLKHREGHFDERPPKYRSLSCIGNSGNHETETYPIKKRPVVCGNFGIISSGESNTSEKPARILPLCLILKKAKIIKSNLELKPNTSVAQETEKACVDVKEPLLDGHEDAFLFNNKDFSEDACLGKNSNVCFDRYFMSGSEHYLSKLGCRKAYKSTSMSSGSNIQHSNASAIKQWIHRRNWSDSFTSNADSFCCVCGGSNKEELNCLLKCNRCLIKVHQACYGISKVPQGLWYCRPCKTNSRNIACVLCGYEDGAMTRALKCTNIVRSLLKAWKIATGYNSQKPVKKFGAADYQDRGPSLLESEYNFSLAVGLVSSEVNPDTAVNMIKHCQESIAQEPYSFPNKIQVFNSVIAGALDPSVMQWVHVVCGLWTPGTRCPNVNTMSSFDVSGASPSKKNNVCSICNRPGGSCIKCRVTNCSIYFHPWCAHQKGLLQSETEGDDSDKVGFYGRCILHASKHYHDADDDVHSLSAEAVRRREKDWTCARTERFKGRKNERSFNPNHPKSFRDRDACIVSQVQINAWVYINGQKSCSRSVVKPASPDVDYDLRKEYIRYKLIKGWKHLLVYKSGIHALGLYTSQFFAQGAMVVEYVGEVVGLRVADKRETEYQSGRQLQCKSACYFFRIDTEHIIDATRKGGIARFVNHSCQPNCVAKIISIRNDKKVIFLAERDIYPGEEITYDYHFNHEDEGKKIPCFCNSRNCRRYLN
ncbi:Histone-lysine N-methyltransferase ATX2 [Apostasia shenzhenica]|uniref:Histone-lysine N-methyltransferase ATX2 n=1 Tax=Apostasia shenzhenica TaxID=1088818 RepID=A0A2I0B3T2_9ASPA|nr:Histone-lysine N-methyltransferase ATX2 [Apostasia shenzhenica]